MRARNARRVDRREACLHLEFPEAASIYSRWPLISSAVFPLRLINHRRISVARTYDEFDDKNNKRRGDCFDQSSTIMGVREKLFYRFLTPIFWGHAGFGKLFLPEKTR